MSDNSRTKLYKNLQGNQNTEQNHTLLEVVTEGLTQAQIPTLTQSVPTTYMSVHQTQQLQQTTQPQLRSQTTNIDSHKHIQSHSQSLIHVQALAISQAETNNCSQSPSVVQITPRVVTQALVYSHPEVIPQAHSSTQSGVHTSQSQSHIHTHSQPHTQSQVLTPTEVHTQSQGSTHIQNVSLLCSQLQANSQLLPTHEPHTQVYPPTHSQEHTQVATSEALTQTQVHTQPQAYTQTHIHIQPQVHSHTQIHTQAHTHLQMQSDSQSQVQQVPSAETHIPVQSPLLSLPIQSQVPSLSQVSLTTSLPDLVENPQIETSSQKNSEGLEIVHIPVSSHGSSSTSVQDLHSSSVTMNDVLTASSHTQLMHTLTAFPLADALNTSITLQQNSATVSPAQSQSFTQNQILDALVVERVLMASRTGLGQSVVTEEPSVEMTGLPSIQVQENFASCREHPLPSTTVPSIKGSEVSKSMGASHMCTSLINSQEQLGGSQSHNLHLLTADDISPALPDKVSTSITTTSKLIASNRMLNKLLDTGKPHIPSQVTKAAEIAHLVPNPMARLPSSSSSSSGELQDSADLVFAVSSCGSSSLTTSTLSSMASMSTVSSSSVRGGGGGDIGIQPLSSSPGDNIFGLSSSFHVPGPTLVIPTAVSNGPIITQRQIDSVQQALMSSNTLPNIAEQQLEGLSTEGLRLFSPLTNVSLIAPVNSSNVSNVNSFAIVLPPDKTIKKATSTSFHPCNVSKPFSLLGVQEGISKGEASLDSSARFQSSSCGKFGLITSTDPMFTSVTATSGCSSPTSLTTVIPTRLSSTSQEGLGRVKSASLDARVSNYALVDLLNRVPVSDTVCSTAGGMSLMMSDSRLPHTTDVLLSELHRSDESDLSLGASLSTTTGEEIQNTSPLSTEPSLVTGMGGESVPLQELPSPSLSNFSLPNITGDFMVNEVSGGKNSHPNHAQLSALLSNLPTSDLDRFLDNSNTSMCIDISLSDSEVSLNAESSFTYSPGKSHVHRKSMSTTTSELTFTSALKNVTTKSSSEEVKLHSDPVSLNKLLNQEPIVLQEPIKSLSVKMNLTDPISDQDGLHAATAKSEILSPNSTRANADSKSPYSSKGKSKDSLRKNELLVQQVACFKCRLCSFLNQDKSEVENHMREHHSQYYSDDSEDEGLKGPPTKRVKVLMPQSECVLLEGISNNLEPKKSRVIKESIQKDKIKSEFAKETNLLVKMEKEETLGKVRMRIKSEPRDVGEFEGCLINEEEGEDSAGLTIELGEGGHTMIGNQGYVEEEDTTDSAATSESTITSGTTTMTKKTVQPTQSPTLKNIIPEKRKSAKKSYDASSIRCDVNGCGVRMKTETNIAYHRKCHVSSMLQCQECLSTKFQGWRDLALHLWRHHLIDMELHKCDKCDYKSYSYSKLMNVHHRIHSDERPSLCDICGKRFKTPKQLRNHKTLHLKKTELPQHQCEICHRPFSDKRMLRNHQESVHKKVKPFLCNYCGYSTASRSTLKMHMRQHTGEKPFACEKCKYRTSDHNSLRRHKMQHSGVRPYRCPYCDYASIQSTTFKVHLKDKHPGLAQIDGIMFTCGVCSFKTVKRDNFLAHVAEHSKGEGRKQKQPVSLASGSKMEECTDIFGDLGPYRATNCLIKMT